MSISRKNADASAARHDMALSGIHHGNYTAKVVAAIFANLQVVWSIFCVKPMF